MRVVPAEGRSEEVHEIGVGTRTPAPAPPVSDSRGATRCAWRQIQSRYPALSAVVLEESDGGYRLGGRVPTYYLKQVALAAACEVAGHRPIFNEIEVITPNPRPGRGTWGTSAPTAPPRELEGRLVP